MLSLKAEKTDPDSLLFPKSKYSGSVSPDKGFTLLEVMVALAIIAIALVSIFKMHTQTISMNISAKAYTTAAFLAQGKLAELEAASLFELSSDSGDFGETFPDYKWSFAVADVDSEILGNVAEDLKKIVITVSFNDDEYRYNLATCRFISE